MDEEAPITYLTAMLLRRILTALALITGLAATGAPASATAMEALGEQIEAGAASIDQGHDKACKCVLQRGIDPMKQLPQRDCRTVRRKVVVFIPTLQFGPDRALE